MSELEKEKRDAPSKGGAFRRFVWPGALALLVLAAFARSLWAAPIWDDEFLTVRNPNLASLDGLRKLLTSDIWSSSALGTRSGYYRPIASLSYALNRLLGGNSAASYHAGNVILHAVVAVLAWVFLTRRKIARPAIAGAAVALFATMPLVAEPVSWIAGRYDVLGAAFTLGALVANGGRKRAWAAPLAVLAALLSKEPYALAVGLVVLDDVFLLRRPWRGEIAKYVACVAAVALDVGLRRAVHVPSPERLFAEGGVLALVRAYAFAWKTFAVLAVHPIDLSFFHTYVPPSALACALVMLAVAIACGAALFGFWRERSPARGGLAFGALLCAAAMVPGALTGPTLWIIGDRYAYFPLLGATVALAAGAQLLALRFPKFRAAPLVIAALALAQLPRLESRLGELQSPDSMYDATLARDPDNFTTLTLRANELAATRDWEGAERMYLHAREVAPLHGDIDTGLAFVHIHERRYADAEIDARRAVAEKPSNSRAWLNLATALVNEDRAPEAIDAATRAIAVRPSYAEAYLVRAIGELELGRVGDAREDLERVLAIDPSHARARALLAKTRAMGGPR